jgi:hypothetical protein
MSDKNRTYERALSAFFQGTELTTEQQERLPSEVDGVSVQRKKLIKAVLSASGDTARLSALKRLDERFGLPSDLQVLSYALSPDAPPLALKALKRLVVLIAEEPPELINAFKEELLERLSSLEIRLFQEEALELTQRCLRALRALPPTS